MSVRCALKKLGVGVNCARNFRGYSSLTPSKPPLHELPDYFKYSQQIEATMGFGVDIDLGDYPDAIRPYPGSLDDANITSYALFALDDFSKYKNKHCQLLRVVKANNVNNSFYLTFDGIDDYGEKKRYRALVVDRGENGLELELFGTYGDADAPLQQYANKVVYRFKDEYGGSYCKDNETFDPKTMVAEECYYPRDYFKYLDQVHSSEGFHVDEELDLGLICGRICRISELDDPSITSVSHFAVNQHNNERSKHLQFVRVIKGTRQAVCGVVYYLTLEVMDDAEEKIYQAKVWDNVGSMELLLFRLVDDTCRL